MKINVDISFERMQKKTQIVVENRFFEHLAEDYKDIVTTEFIPPLFDSFAIVAPPADNSLRETQYFYIEYTTRTEFTFIVFKGKTKIRVIDCHYDGNLTGIQNKIRYFNEELRKSRYFNELPLLMNISMIHRFAVVYYMLHYSTEVEYLVSEVNEIKPSKEETSGNKKSKPSQKIILKSKKKQYILKNDNLTKEERKQKEKVYTTMSWYVRGYYQRFGIDKHLVYIPPRINYRKNADNTEKPQNKKYIVKK